MVNLSNGLLLIFFFRVVFVFRPGSGNTAGHFNKTVILDSTIRAASWYTHPRIFWFLQYFMSNRYGQRWNEPASRISVINFISHHASRWITTTTTPEHTKQQQVNKSDRAAVVMHSNADFKAFCSLQDDGDFIIKMQRWLLTLFNVKVKN